jgi:CHAD domain-containing protein
MMELELGNVRKPLRQLRKSLKSLPSDPPMKEVHDLRTRARRVEAIVAVLMPGNDKRANRLLKTLKPVRKAAGKVRDMDVLAAKALTLAGRTRNRSVARLLEYLRAMRVESVGQLLKTLARQRTDARHSLEQFSRQIERRFNAKNPRASSRTTGNQPHASAAIRLMDELGRWPAFTAENLHAFRIKVKELRYVMQLAQDADLKFVNALEKVKRQIGDWHDWQQLEEIAGNVLKRREDRTVLKKIGEIGTGKCNRALAAAYALKTRYLNVYADFAVSEP